MKQVRIKNNLDFPIFVSAEGKSNVITSIAFIPKEVMAVEKDGKEIGRGITLVDQDAWKIIEADARIKAYLKDGQLAIIPESV